MAINKMGKVKVVYVSGTRADFGLMTSILTAINESRKLKLFLYATGMHLMPKYGNTLLQIKEIFPNVKKLPAVFKDNQPSSVARFCTSLMKHFIDEMIRVKPDIILVLGDRVEMITVSLASLYLGIPIAHIHGGERSMTVDEVARHAITKMASLHFPATEESAERIKKMGEDPWRITVVGAPALDIILNEKLLSKKELEVLLGYALGEYFALVTLHPVTSQESQAARQMKIVLNAIKEINIPTVIIYPNADSGGDKMIKVIEKERNNSLFHIHKSLPFKVFLSLEKEASVWIGNSSALLLESPSFKTPVVNIGIRQKNRQHGDNVINVDYDVKAIVKALRKSLYDILYLNRILKTKTPWGDGNTGKRVAKKLEDVKLDKKLLNKQITY